MSEEQTEYIYTYDNGATELQWRAEEVAALRLQVENLIKAVKRMSAALEAMTPPKLTEKSG